MPGVPDVVSSLAASRPCRLIWCNAFDGLTFEIGAEPNRRFVKWLPRRSGITVADEVARLRWARNYVSVPPILSTGCNPEATWVVTAALAGRCAIADHWLADPAAAVRAIGRGLRALHDALPVRACPFSWNAQLRVAAVRRRATLGGIHRAQLHPEHAGLEVVEALGRLTVPPPVDALVVCHGDACAPNTLIDDDGSCSGHTDLGALGVADRWADLAIATWSATWNFGPGFEDQLLEAYGVEPDPLRTAYYRLLWDLEG
jgi:aminoglycoside phosphotransferase